jgi:coenzyme F420-reducing hydrogenase delta subunit
VKARMKALTNSLERLDINPKRLQVVEVPQGNPGKFTSAANAFMEDIRSIGPLV